MSSLVNILTELTESYFKASHGDGRETRLVIPGLTRRIAQDLQRELLDRQLPSYLVVARSERPDKNQGWIYADGLTSKRYGSMIIIASPGEVSFIQDSITGSGGPFRSMAFSDEWPWLDEGNEQFRFSGRFLDELVANWTTTPIQQLWFKEFIRAGLLPALRDLPNRAEVLLEQLLSTFHSELYAELDDVCLQFLHHCGVPRPPVFDPGDSSLHKDLSDLCTTVASAVREGDGRKELLETIERKFVESEREAVTRSVMAFLDGLGTAPCLDRGLRALSPAWSPGEDLTNWQRLDTSTLERVFDIAAKGAELKAHLECKRGLISDNRRYAATLEGEIVQVHCQYSLGDASGDDSDYELRLASGRMEITRTSNTSENVPYAFDVNVAALELTDNALSKRIPLKLELLRNGRLQKHVKLGLHLCGEQRPFFAVVQEGFSVTDGIQRDSPTDADADADADAETVSVRDPTYIYLLSRTASDDVSLLCEDTPLQLRQHQEGILRTNQAVDPADSPGGTALLIARAGPTFTIHLTLDSKGDSQGKYTLEEELVFRLSSGSRKHVTELCSILAGDTGAPYPFLGSLPARASFRHRVTQLMERGDGWRALVVNMSGEHPATEPTSVGLSRSWGAEGTHSLALSGALREQVEDLLSRYGNARNAVLAAIRANLSAETDRLDRPLYAVAPMFVESRSEELREVLVNSLEAYSQLNAFLDKYADDLDWGEAFALRYVDCVVDWSPGSLRHQAVVFGPWHPLVAATRFMVQAGLYDSCKAFRKRDSRDSFNRLATLLHESSGFRWFPALHGQSVSFVHAYVSRTSDPGWMLCIKTDTTDQETVCGHLERLLDLYAGNDLHDPGDSLPKYVRGFFRAYPSRRTVSVRVAGHYNARTLIQDTASLIQASDTPTRDGVLLPGGIGLHLDRPPPYDMESLPWADPPLRVSECEREQECFNTHNIDISILPRGGRETAWQTCSSPPVPRGHGDGATFYLPLMHLTEGQSATPTSVYSELEGEENAPHGRLEGSYRRCLLQWKAALRHTECSFTSIQLPLSLQTPWTIVPGAQLDPAALVKYVRNAYEQGDVTSIEQRALWGYNVDFTKGFNTYYVLSKVPPGFRNALSGSPVLNHTDLSTEFLRELGEVGFAIGSEAMRSSNHSVGVIGVVGAIRLFRGTEESPGPLQTDDCCAGFVLPVDSFVQLLQDKDDDPPDTMLATQGMKRADLAAVQLRLAGENGELFLSLCVIECKYRGTTLSQRDSDGALNQAQQTFDRLDALAEAARGSNVAARLALAHIVSFGLRLSCDDDRASLSRNARMLQAVLRGQITPVKASMSSLLISTECGLREARCDRHRGRWIQLAPNHWPGLAESASLRRVRSTLAALFRDLFGGTEVSSTNTTPPPTPDFHSALHPSGESASPEEPTTESDRPRSDKPDRTTVARTDTTPPSSTDSQHDLHPGAETTAPDQPDAAPDQSQSGEPDGITATDDGKSLGPVLLGVDDVRGTRVFYDPQSADSPLDNMNVMITGSPGKGKTQQIKSLVCSLRQQGLRVIVLDFKNDYAADRAFVAISELEAHFVAFGGLPYNPLIPTPIRDPNTDTLVVQCPQHISGLASVVCKTFGLGPQQEAAFRDAIRDAFQDFGSPTGNVTYEESQEYPDFTQVGERMRADNVKAYNRLAPLFDLGLFRTDYQQRDFGRVLESSLAIDLSGIQSDRVKNTLAQVIVLSAHAHYNRREHAGGARQFFVFDEAHRVLDSQFLPGFVRECRAYGVGMILSSQFPSEFGPVVAGCLSTKIIHGNDRTDAHVKDIVRLLGYEGRVEDVQSLDVFEAFVSNKHYNNARVRMLAFPLYLLASHLQRFGPRPVTDIGTVAGIDPSKLPLNFLIDRLKDMRLIEDRDGMLYFVPDGA